jgi:ATP-binding cassette, subfamily C (CFTR/MRP), member 1
MGSAKVAQAVPGRQKVWAAAVQKRIAITASCLSSMKGVRMMGLSRTMTSILQDQRIRELKLQASFRWLTLWLNAIGKKALPIFQAGFSTRLRFSVLM